MNWHKYKSSFLPCGKQVHTPVMDADGVKTALAAKRQELKQLETDIAELEETAAAIGASNEAGQAERQPKFHAFDYMQNDVKQWEQMRNETIGGCGCSGPAPAAERPKKAVFMASEVEQWEAMINRTRAENDDDKDEEEES